MHLTLAFSQLAQDGSFWSHLFFRNRHLLQALTFLKDELWTAGVDVGSLGGEAPDGKAGDAE